MDSIRQVFKLRLRELRGKRTQEQFSEFLGIPMRSYQKMETGVIPQQETLDTIVAKTGIRSETALFLDPDLTKPTYQQALDVLTEYGASLAEAAQSSSEVEAEKHAPQCNVGKLPSRRS